MMKVIFCVCVYESVYVWYIVVVVDVLLYVCVQCWFVVYMCVQFCCNSCCD